MMQRSSNGSRGALLVCVLVCMSIAVSISLTAIHASLRERRQLATEQQMVQTCWIADAGLTRAIQALSSNSSYDGEQLLIPAANHAFETKLNIIVQRSDLSQRPTKITATAIVSNVGQRPVHTQHTAECSLP